MTSEDKNLGPIVFLIGHGCEREIRRQELGINRGSLQVRFASGIFLTLLLQNGTQFKPGICEPGIYFNGLLKVFDCLSESVFSVRFETILEGFPGVWRGLIDGCAQ